MRNKVVPFVSSRKTLPRATAALREMLVEYISEMFGSDIGREAMRAIPIVLSDATSWSAGSTELSTRINRESELIADRFGSSSFSLVVSVKSMLKKIGEEYSCEPIVIAREVAAAKGEKQ